MSLTLVNLPEDVLITLTNYLDTIDIISLRRVRYTSKRRIALANITFPSGQRSVASNILSAHRVAAGVQEIVTRIASSRPASHSGSSGTRSNFSCTSGEATFISSCAVSFWMVESLAKRLAEGRNNHDRDSNSSRGTTRCGRPQEWQDHVR